MNTVRFALTALGTLAVLAPTAAPAQIFECINARGAREFAQVCPAGTVRQRQLSRSDEPATPAAGDGKSAAQLDVEFRKRQQERLEAEAKAAESRGKVEEAERNCTQARTQLKGLLEGQRIQRVDPDTGERSFLGDEERAAEAERQRQLVAQWCK